MLVSVVKYASRKAILHTQASNSPTGISIPQLEINLASWSFHYGKLKLKVEILGHTICTVLQQAGAHYEEEVDKTLLSASLLVL